MAQDHEYHPYEDLNKDINRHTCVIGIFPTDAMIIRLVESLLLVQQEEWQLDKHRVFLKLSTAKLVKNSQLQD